MGEHIENIDHYLSRSELFNSEDLERAIGIIFRDYPELKILDFEDVGSSNVSPAPYSPGEFVPPATSNEKPLIKIGLADSRHLDMIRETRRVATAIWAKKLGVNPDNVDNRLLSTFILLHEVGHGHDYIRNYFTNPEFSDVQAATEEWYHHYENQLASLPVPHYDPSDLREAIGIDGSLEDFVTRFPELKERLAALNIANKEELYAMQEAGYRALPHEGYADDFAVFVLRTY